jgi:hypothetical protein
MGKRRGETTRRRWSASSSIAILIAVLLAGGAAAWFLFFREGAPIELGGRPVPEFSFELGKVRGATVAGSPSQQQLEEGAEAVRETITALYTAGFVDPGEWDGGTFPAVLEQFEDGVMGQAEADLEFLTLGDTSNDVDFVKPAKARMSVRFLVDARRRLTAAVITTNFVADGRFRDGRPFIIRHGGTFYLRPGPDGHWVIVGYDVNGKLERGRRPAVASPTTGGSP